MQLVDELPDLVCRLRVDGTLQYVNLAYAEYFDRLPGQLIGTNFLDLVPDDVRADAERVFAAACELTPQRPTRESEHRGGDGPGLVRWQHWVDKAVFDSRNRVIELLCVGRDVTERRAMEQQIRYHARYDSLTGLVNRRGILESLDQAVTACAAGESDLGLLYIDLDDFKVVNDLLGHRAGDQLLSDVAAALDRSVRGTDAAGRIGGDEFIVICSPIESIEELHEIAGRIADRLHRLPRPIGASFGAVLLQPDESVDALLHRADEAMYAVKQQRMRLRRLGA